MCVIFSRLRSLRCRSPGGVRNVAPPWHFSEVAEDSFGRVIQLSVLWDSRIALFNCKNHVSSTYSKSRNFLLLTFSLVISSDYLDLF